MGRKHKWPHHRWKPYHLSGTHDLSKTSHGNKWKLWPLINTQWNVMGFRYHHVSFSYLGAMFFVYPGPTWGALGYHCPRKVPFQKKNNSSLWVWQGKGGNLSTVGVHSSNVSTLCLLWSFALAMEVFSLNTILYEKRMNMVPSVSDICWYGFVNSFKGSFHKLPGKACERSSQWSQVPKNQAELHGTKAPTRLIHNMMLKAQALQTIW